MSEKMDFKLSFLQNKIFGEYLEEDENVLYIIQAHVLLILYQFFIYFLILIPTLAVWFIWSDNKYVFLVALTIVMLSSTFMGLKWYNWYADAFILTDKNIIFIEWDSIVKIKSSRISYTEVESASVELEGFFGTMMGFGELKIETANEAFTPRLKGARKASEAERAILQNKAIYAKQDSGVEADIFKKALREIMDEYFDKDKSEDSVEALEEENLNFSKYKIRGERFHMHDAKDANPEDLKADRYEKYRVLEDNFLEDDKKNISKSEKKTLDRFNKYRKSEKDDSKKYD